MKELSARIITPVPGPESQKMLERRKNIVARGISYSAEIFVDEAKGALIKDIDGNVFIDFASGIGAVNIGHGEETVIAAIKEQCDKYLHTSFNVCMYEPYIALAEKLAMLIPGRASKKVMFANSGAEAVENAVKIARKYTGKTGIVSLDSSFHGRTYMAMTLTSKIKPYKDGFEPFNSDTYKIPSPNCYRCACGKEPSSCGLACAESFKTMLESSLSPDMVAAVIAEPVQGEGGFIVAPKGYLERIQQICQQHNILLILDEIQTGIGRTGKLFACEHSGIEPDLLISSKSLGGGLPLSAVIGKAEIMDAPISGAIGGTFGGNPASCVAALKVLEKMENDKLPQRAEQLGQYMLSRLREMQQKYAVIGDVRGLGAMVAVELVTDRSTKVPDKEIVKKVISACLHKGIIFLSAGIFGNCIRFLPPLVMTDSQAAYGMDVLDEAIGAAI